MRFLALVTAIVLWSAEMATAQVGAPLGPKDGAGLPPTDLARVAVGSSAPDFTLESKDGGTVTLSSFRGRADVVLVFYRGHW
jgi:cytochrome oxidase Cu insertion factor (SCO1/SenC/PrrC family)